MCIYIDKNRYIYYIYFFSFSFVQSSLKGKKGGEPTIDLDSRREGSPRYGGGYAGDGGGGAGAFGSGSFGHHAAVSGTSQSAVLQPTEFSVWRMIEAMDGKPLAAAFFGAQRSGKTQTTGALLHSLQAIMGFEKLLYGLGANSSYDSPDNVTLRQFVHNDQVTVISCPADIGNLIDRAVSTNEKKVLVLDDIMHVLEGNATKKIGILCSMGRKSRTSFVGIFHANIPKDQVGLVQGWMT